MSCWRQVMGGVRQAHGTKRTYAIDRSHVRCWGHFCRVFAASRPVNHDPEQTYRSKGGFGLLPCHLDVQLLNKPSILLEVLAYAHSERLGRAADRLLR